MSDGPLVGISGKIKILLDRLTSTRAANLDKLTTNTNLLATTTDTAKAVELAAVKAKTDTIPAISTNALAATRKETEFLSGGASTFTIPSGVNMVYVTMIAGGGGGGGGTMRSSGSSKGYGGGGGGGAGSIAMRVPLAVTPLATIAVFVGSGGSGGAGGDSPSGTSSNTYRTGDDGNGGTDTYVQGGTHSITLRTVGGKGGLRGAIGTTETSNAAGQSKGGAQVNTAAFWGNQPCYGPGSAGGNGGTQLPAITSRPNGQNPSGSLDYYGRSGANKGTTGSSSFIYGGGGGGGGHGYRGDGGTGGASGTSVGGNGGAAPTHTGAGGGGGSSTATAISNVNTTYICGSGGAGGSGYVLIEY